MIVFLGKSYGPTRNVNYNGANVILDEQSAPELASLYRLVASNLGEPEVRRFSDKPTAVKRTWAILERYAASDAASEPVQGPGEILVNETGTKLTPGDEPNSFKLELSPEDKAKVEAPVADAPKAKVERKKRGMRFVFPAESEVKEAREGTARAAALALLKREGGASFAEVMEATGWNEKQAYEGIRIIHYYLGWGMKQDAEGRITVHK